jgi:diguanylate cyclase (GGDEF)-like protein/PAS domain S-box-containing protein
MLTFGALAAGVAVLDLVLPDHGRGVPFIAYAVVLSFGVEAGIRRHRPSSAAPWRLLLATNVTAALAVAQQSAIGSGELDLPRAAQALILVGLLCGCVSSALFVRARSRVLDRFQLLDLAIILVSATVALQRLVLEPMIESHPPQGMTPDLAMNYVVLEAIVVVLYIRYVTLPGPRPVALWLLLSSLVASFIGFGLSSVSAETGLHLSLLATGFVTMLAALHPSMAALTEPSPATTPTFGPIRAALLGVAVLLPPATAASVQVRTHELPMIGFLVPTAVVTMLVLVRLRLQFADEQRARDELEASRAQFRALVHGISDVIVLVGDGDEVRYASASSSTTLGVDSDQLLGRQIGAVVHPEDAVRTTSAVAGIRGSGDSVTVQVGIQVGDAQRMFEAVLTDRLADPSVGGVILVLRDVTERHELEARLRHQALHDGLTDLPNRAMLADRLGAAHRRGGASLLFIDLDDFKSVNDGLGHHIGDQLLCEVSARLRDAVRDDDLVARLGGDEFAVLVEGGGTLDVAERVLAALREPFEIAGHRLVVEASVGVASDAASVEELLRHADEAMYRAKAAGKGRLAVFQHGEPATPAGT